ncbi:MAG: hypothetical protein JWM58_4326 [Rhizobium sp.]|nr:hypothetical protein [Rhizobium sp.]
MSVENVGGKGIGPTGTRLEGQRHLVVTAEIGLIIEIGVGQSHADSPIRRQRFQRGIVDQAGCMRQQMMDGNIRRPAIRHLRMEPRQMIGNPVLQSDQTTLDHCQRGHGNDRLGHRGQPKDRIEGNGPVCFPIREPGSAAKYRHAILMNEHHGSGDPPRFQRMID